MKPNLNLFASTTINNSVNPSNPDSALSSKVKLVRNVVQIQRYQTCQVSKLVTIEMLDSYQDIKRNTSIVETAGNNMIPLCVFK